MNTKKRAVRTLHTGKLCVAYHTNIYMCVLLPWLSCQLFAHQSTRQKINSNDDDDDDIEQGEKAPATHRTHVHLSCFSVICATWNRDVRLPWRSKCTLQSKSWPTQIFHWRRSSSPNVCLLHNDRWRWRRRRCSFHDFSIHKTWGRFFRVLHRHKHERLTRTNSEQQTTTTTTAIKSNNTRHLT